MGRFLFALLVLFVVTSVIAGPYTVVSPSMEDTLMAGDTVLLLKYHYALRLPVIGVTLFRFNDPAPGDLLMFDNPVSPGDTYVKRCAAVAGQTVRIERKKLFIDGAEVPLPSGAKNADPDVLKKGPSGKGRRDYFEEMTVPDGTVFVLGDNRDYSIDSRIFGPVPVDNLRGKVGPVILSVDPAVSWKNVGAKFRLSRMGTFPE